MKKRNPCFADVTGLDRLTGGDYCHSRRLLAYATRQHKGIVLKNCEDNTEKTLEATGIGEANPLFSPDGSKLLFLAVKPGEGRQIYSCDLDTMTVEQVTVQPGVAMEPLWSPDGTKIAFLRVVDKSVSTRGDEPIVIEDFGYKFDGRGYIQLDEHMHLFVVDVATKKEQCVADGACDYMHHAWLPDSRHLVCESDRFRSKAEGLGYDLLKIDAETKELTQLSKDLWLVSYPNPVRPVPLQDGKWVIAGVLDPKVPMAESDELYPEVYFYRIATDGSQRAEQIFFGDKTCYQCVQFPYNACGGWGLEKAQLDENGETLYFVSGWQGQCNIYVLDLHGDGHARLVAGGKQVYHGLGKIRQGKMLVSKVTATTPEAYYLLDVQSGQEEQLLYQSAQEFLDKVHVEPTEDVYFDCLDGAGKVHGYVIAPYDKKPGVKYPVILYIHGGPTPFYTYGLTLEHHSFAAQGFGVIFCNPRGSTGYGWEHQAVQGEDLDRCTMMDCLQFVDEVVRQFDWADPDRVGVTGGSFGGYMTNYLATHTKRFKAYVSQRSVVNQMIEYASADLQGISRHYTSFEEFMVDKIKASPVALAERIDRPFLILHGEEDYRTPVEGAHQLYTAIRDIHPDLPLRMVIFPHTGHEQPTDPGQSEIYYREMLTWFQKYL